MSSLRSREIERERKKNEFRTYGRQYTKEKADYTDIINKVSTEVRNAHLMDLERESEARKKELARAAKDRARRTNTRREEYDNVLTSPESFEWQKPYFEKQNERHQANEKEFAALQEDAKVLDQRWESEAQARQQRKQERLARLEKEHQEQQRQLEELQKWKSGRREKLEEIRRERNRLYEEQEKEMETKIKEKYQSIIPPPREIKEEISLDDDDWVVVPHDTKTDGEPGEKGQGQDQKESKGDIPQNIDDTHEDAGEVGEESDAASNPVDTDVPSGGDTHDNDVPRENSENSVTHENLSEDKVDNTNNTGDNTGYDQDDTTDNATDDQDNTGDHGNTGDDQDNTEDNIEVDSDENVVVDTIDENVEITNDTQDD